MSIPISELGFGAPVVWSAVILPLLSVDMVWLNVTPHKIGPLLRIHINTEDVSYKNKQYKNEESLQTFIGTLSQVFL